MQESGVENPSRLNKDDIFLNAWSKMSMRHAKSVVKPTTIAACKAYCKKNPGQYDQSLKILEMLAKLSTAMLERHSVFKQNYKERLFPIEEVSKYFGQWSEDTSGKSSTY